MPLMGFSTLRIRESLASTRMTRRRYRGLLHRGWRITRIELPPRDHAGAPQRSSTLRNARSRSS